MADNKKISNLQMGLTSAGALGGLYYAFSKKKGAWGYIGFFILGSIAGGLTASVIESVTKKNTTSTPIQPAPTTTTPKVETETM